FHLSAKFGIVACLRPSHAAIHHAQLHVRMLRHSPKNRRHVLNRMSDNGQQAEPDFRSLGHARSPDRKKARTIKIFHPEEYNGWQSYKRVKQGLHERARGTRPHNDPYRARSGALYIESSPEPSFVRRTVQLAGSEGSSLC